MDLIVEGARTFRVGGIARVVEHDREFAWAERSVRKQPDVRYILGNFVQAETPNSNGHIFPLADLDEAIGTIPNKPLNINHAPGRRVGTYVDAEKVYPVGGETAEEANPIVEALAAFWEYYEPDLWPAIAMAHREGSLFFSMETVPKTITCRGKGSFEGCGKNFEYAGRQSPTYCDHLNETASRKILHSPHFTAGALIIPPVRPGWKRAHVTELSQLMENESEQADRIFKEIAAAEPHLNTDQIEHIIAWFLAQ